MKRPSRPLAKRQGIIFILSAPSGAGKTTLYNGLARNLPGNSPFGVVDDTGAPPR